MMMINEHIPHVSVEELDVGFCDEVAALPGGENIKKCLACGTCAAGCPITQIDETYNCRTIIRKILLGMREEVLQSPVIWYCLMCYRCYSRCPQKVNFTDIMRALRFLAVKHNYIGKEILTGSNDIENLSQMVRRDMVKEYLEGKKKTIEEIRAKVNQYNE